MLVGGAEARARVLVSLHRRERRGSRIGRTLTAPADGDARTVRFAFVSCQNVCQGAQNAYRRMIFEDERAPAAERLGFVLHLGDFIYEMVWYPEDRPQGMYDRRLRDVVRYAHGEKISDFHIPTTSTTIARCIAPTCTIRICRMRARAGRSSRCGTTTSSRGSAGRDFRSSATRRGRRRRARSRRTRRGSNISPRACAQPADASLERFDAPKVVDAPVTRFDADGLGDEPNNLTAIASLHRLSRAALRPQRRPHDHGSAQLPLRGADHPPGGRGAHERGFPGFRSAGSDGDPRCGPRVRRRASAGEHPLRRREVPNFRKDQPPQTMLGRRRRKRGSSSGCKTSSATWKIWGNSLGTLDWRADPQNLPPGLTKPWPGAGYAGFGGGDHSAAYVERAEIYDFVRERGITGFATVAGDRHSFWAGLAAKALPPEKFEPVGVAFITGSVSAPGLPEASEHRFPKDHPLRPLFLAQTAGQSTWEPTVNLLLHHGVRSCLEYRRAATSSARGGSRIRISRRTCRSSTWAVTATRRCA